MADQTDYNIPVRTWVRVALNSATVTMTRKDPHYKYFRTYLPTGGAAPTTPPKDTGIPENASQMFLNGDKELILNDAGMDVYVTAVPLHQSDTTGVVTVDA